MNVPRLGNSPSERSSATLQQIGLMLAFFAAVAITVEASQPGWWTSTGAVTSGGTPQDYQAASQGQLKQFTEKATLYLNANLTNGAGSTLSNMVAGWSNDYRTHGYTALNPATNDLKAINQGQLKYIANLVYGRLSANGYYGLVPGWIQTNSHDYNLANQAQLKTVFNFDLSTPPAAVANLTAYSPTNGTIELNWTLPAVNNANAITVQQSLDGGATWAVVTTMDAISTGFTVTGLDTNSSYSFQVIASNTHGSSSPTPPSDPTTPVPKPPVSPSKLTGNLDASGNMNLSWQSSPHATSYVVDRETIYNSIWTNAYATITTGTSYQDIVGNRPFPTGYRYRVHAVNLAGTSLASAEYPLPRYVVVDLGTNFNNPVKITQSGYIAGSFTAGDIGVWHNGATTTLQPKDTAANTWSVEDIGEDGTVIGYESVPATYTYVATGDLPDFQTFPITTTDLAVWSPSNAQPQLTDGPVLTETVSDVIMNPEYGDDVDTLTVTAQAPYEGYGIASDGNGNIKFTLKTMVNPYDPLNFMDPLIMDLYKNNQEIGTGIFIDGEIGGDLGAFASLIRNNKDGDFIGWLSEAAGVAFFNNVNTVLDFQPMAISNKMIIGGNTHVYLAGWSYSRPLQIIWWDGSDHTLTPSPYLVPYNYCLPSINAAVTTVTDSNGNPTVKPAVQIVVNAELWEMNPITGAMGSPLNIPDLLPDSSGWTGFFTTGGLNTSHAQITPSVITDNGAIVGTATYSGSDTAIAAGVHGVMLLPLELKDIRNINDVNDDVPIIPMGPFPTDTSKVDAYWAAASNQNIAWIAPHRNDGTSQADNPLMPQVEIRFPGAPDDWKVKYKFKCSYIRGNGWRKAATLDEDTVLIDKTSTPMQANQSWNIYSESEWQGDFFGGNCELTYQIINSSGSIILPEATIRFVIAGKNPDANKAKLYIQFLTQGKDSALGHAYAIAKEESRDYAGPAHPYYNQFFTSYLNQASKNETDWRAWRPGFPVFNDDSSGPGGYGLFQNTRENIPRREIWNWQDNAIAGINELQTKIGVATRYYSRIQRRSAIDKAAFLEDPPPLIPVGSHNFTSTEAIMIYTYNGTGTKPDGTDATIDYRYPFDSTKSPGLGADFRWFWNPHLKYKDSPRTYVGRVEKEIDP